VVELEPVCDCDGAGDCVGVGLGVGAAGWPVVWALDWDVVCARVLWVLDCVGGGGGGA
jgi:hypothetical protein